MHYIVCLYANYLLNLFLVHSSYKEKRKHLSSKVILEFVTPIIFGKF